jgi:hypothetical protein
VFCAVQGTLPLKELTICNLQQNGNYSQPQEFALQINGELTFNLKIKNDELHVLVVSRTETAWSAEMLQFVCSIFSIDYRQSVCVEFPLDRLVGCL